ncbi:MAG: family 78 glycoside hydrolase catalytic domain, partial [Clostridia bacterium]|nr:family 78 glycoside hydrolase catalytic domain [Clostridia bacterium]
VSVTRKEDRMLLDFGGIYVGYLSAKAKGVSGDVITLYAGQELNEDGSVRHAMRCNCDYTEEWILSGGEDILNQFDFKSFRYAELVIPEGVTVEEVCLVARHYPFILACDLHREFAENDMAKKIWELCVRSQRVGVQETIQDCMDREKGFYLGDGCYSAFANYLLTGDDSMTRKLIDDAFASSFITEGLVTCMDCSFMQEIAEFPLILADLILWHYRASGDKEYLRENYAKIQGVLNNYRDSYEKDGLLCDLDRWCVVEWPQNFRDGYAVEIKEGQVCKEPHISINAYYYRAVCALNKMAEALGETPYRDEKELQKAILDAFYDREKHIFYDGVNNCHVSLPGNVFAYAFELVKDEIFDQKFLNLLAEKGEDQTFLFTSFPLLCRWVREGNFESMKKLILHENTWSRMLREDATTTFEGWGKDCKWNTSLFHMTMSAVAMFMADVDLKKIF